MGKDFIMANWKNIEFKNAKYTRIKDADGNKVINLELKFKEGWLPFSLNPADKGALFDTSALYAKVVAEGNVIALSSSEETAELAAEIRDLRDNKLEKEVDPIVSNSLRWEDLSTSKQNEWKAYRTALLGIPQQSGFPNTITWPTKPE